MEYDLVVTAGGEKETDRNPIDERFAAESNRAIRGWDCGVLDNSFYSISSNQENAIRDPNPNFLWRFIGTQRTNIQIGRGMASAYGYDIKSDEDYVFNLDSTFDGKTLFVYLMWDFSDLQFRKATIGIRDNGTTSTWDYPKDNLITKPNGVYVLPLYRFLVSTTGMISGVMTWTDMGAVSGNFDAQAIVNSSSLNVRVYRGIEWAHLCPLADVSKTARTIIDGDAIYGTRASFIIGDNKKITITM